MKGGVYMNKTVLRRIIIVVFLVLGSISIGLEQIAEFIKPVIQFAFEVVSVFVQIIITIVEVFL